MTYGSSPSDIEPLRSSTHTIVTGCRFASSAAAPPSDAGAAAASSAAAAAAAMTSNGGSAASPAAASAPPGTPPPTLAAAAGALKRRRTCSSVSVSAGRTRVDATSVTGIGTDTGEPSSDRSASPTDAVAPTPGGGAVVSSASGGDAKRTWWAGGSAETTAEAKPWPGWSGAPGTLKLMGWAGVTNCVLLGISITITTSVDSTWIFLTLRTSTCTGTRGSCASWRAGAFEPDDMLRDLIFDVLKNRDSVDFLSGVVQWERRNRHLQVELIQVGRGRRGEVASIGQSP